MKFDAPLLAGRLIKRYKRFLADVELESGQIVTAHCANPGSMLGLKQPGAKVWLSPAANPKRKLKFSWEMIKIDGRLVGVNTARPNALVEEAIQTGAIAELTGYATLRREVRYGANSRIDLLLENRAGSTPRAGDAKDNAPCYVEVKSVTLRREGRAEFPDAVTARGAKHLEELGTIAEQGARAVMFYLVQREDCECFAIAADIDPAYARGLSRALARGVEALCYICRLTRREIVIDRPLMLTL
jgi:sugar fermentation stimulation protein A